MIRTAALLLALALPGCATLAGTPIAPVTSAVSTVEHYAPEHWWQYPVFPLTFAYAVVLGTAITPVMGLAADYGYARDGRYGGVGRIPFDAVFDPLDQTGHE